MSHKFKEEIRKWRGKRSQPIAANCLDVSLATYRNWEQGRNEPHAQVQSSIFDTMKRINIKPEHEN